MKGDPSCSTNSMSLRCFNDTSVPCLAEYAKRIMYHVTSYTMLFEQIKINYAIKQQKQCQIPHLNHIQAFSCSSLPVIKNRIVNLYKPIILGHYDTIL